MQVFKVVAGALKSLAVRITKLLRRRRKSPTKPALEEVYCIKPELAEKQLAKKEWWILDED